MNISIIDFTRQVDNPYAEASSERGYQVGNTIIDKDGDHVDRIKYLISLYCDEIFVPVEWPKVQEFMEKEGFEEYSILVNDESMISELGSSCYLIRVSWLKDKV